MYPEKSSLINTLYFSILSSLLLFVGPTFAAVPNAEVMIRNFASVTPQLTKLATALAYVMGMGIMAKGVVGLKHVGEMRTMASREHSLKGPLLSLFVGAALCYLPSSVQVGLSTFWADPNPYGYLKESTDTWAQLTKAVFQIVQLVGGIAFIRGLLMLSHLGEGHQQGALGKAMAHIIGGVFCINMYQLVQVITNTLYLGQQ